MEIKYINNINTEISGTSGKGSFICEYKTLVKVLGQPEEGDEYKTQAEWDIEYKDGTVTTIYDWKQGKCYLGEEGIEPKEVIEWHVGGNEETKSLEHLKDLFISKGYGISKSRFVGTDFDVHEISRNELGKATLIHV
tara:strand:+ start:5203 stop:5613 length:411 start_codon:yes stop_codon:yes gene_type:complete